MTPLETWLGSCFLPYQLRWALDDAPFALCSKGRQLGMTDSCAAWAIMRSFYYGERVLFLSASERIAQEFLGTVRAHCQFLGAVGEQGITDLTTDNKEELTWHSGGRILALSSSERTARSWSGHVVFDEAAHHVDLESVYSAAAPMATRGAGQIRMLSTPAGAQGLWYTLCSSPPEGWSYHCVPLAVAERDGFTVDRARLLALVGGDERMFAEAYECQFLDAQLQLIPSALADAARDWPGEIPKDYDRYVAGLDVGRTRDATALVIIGMDGNIAWVLAVFTCRRTSFAEQKAMIRSARDAFQWDTLHVDETGLGSQLAEELVEQWGETEVRPVRFTQDSKADLFTRALRWHKDGAIRYPHGDDGKTLHRQAISLRRVVTESGNVTFEFPRTADGHGDEFTALTLALKGAGEPTPARGVGTKPIFLVP
jgi:phage FluMu gp28-like protein